MAPEVDSVGHADVPRISPIVSTVVSIRARRLHITLSSLCVTACRVGYYRPTAANPSVAISRQKVNLAVASLDTTVVEERVCKQPAWDWGAGPWPLAPGILTDGSPLKQDSHAGTAWESIP